MWVGRFRFHDDRIVCRVNVTINGSYVMTTVPLIISGNVSRQAPFICARELVFDSHFAWSNILQ